MEDLFKISDIVKSSELIKETRVALLTRTEISQMWHKPNLAVKGFFQKKLPKANP